MKEIKLTQGKISLVDDDDYEEVVKYKWCATRMYNGKWYAIRSVGKRPNKTTISLHKTIIKTDNKKVVDHIDGDGLNNQKSNLRIASGSQNIMNTKELYSSNTSGFRGVHWSNKYEYWVASIQINGKKKNLGTFNSPIEAAKAYDKKAKELFGDFCVNLNLE